MEGVFGNVPRSEKGQGLDDHLAVVGDFDVGDGGDHKGPVGGLPRFFVALFVLAVGVVVGPLEAELVGVDVDGGADFVVDSFVADVADDFGFRVADYARDGESGEKAKESK